MRIRPAQCTLTQGQSQQFEALDDGGAVVPGATWAVTSGQGMIDAAGFFTAPAAIAQAAEATLTGSLPGQHPESATTKVQLVPVEIILWPLTVNLRESERQQFTAKVPGTAAGVPDGVLWTIAPAIGDFNPANAVYTAPAVVADERDIEIIAASAIDPHKSSKATVRLLSKPLGGRQTFWLFVYLVAVFGLVAILIDLWPPAAVPPDMVDRARAVRIAADAAVTTLRDDELKAVAARQAADGLLSATPEDPALIKQKDEATASEARSVADLKAAEEAANNAATNEMALLDQQWPVFNSKMSRDVDLLWLVLISGALGASSTWRDHLSISSATGPFEAVGPSGTLCIRSSAPRWL
jgi:hypothetical protein